MKSKLLSLAQAMAYPGKADELLRWSAELRGMQLPQMPRLPTSLMHPWQPAAKQSCSSEAASASRIESEQNSKPEKQQKGHQQAHTDSASLGSQTLERREESETKSEILQHTHAEDSSSHSTGSDKHYASAPAQAQQGCAKGATDQRAQRAAAAEHAAADDHAQHIWSSWLRWQQK